MIVEKDLEEKLKTILKSKGFDLEKSKADVLIDVIVETVKYIKENAVVTSKLPIPQGGTVQDGKIN